MSLDALMDALLPVLERATAAPWTSVPRPLDRKLIGELLPMVQDRLKRLTDGPELLGLFFEDSVAPAPEAVVQKGMDAASTAAALKEAHALATSAPVFEPEPLERDFRALAERLGLKPGQLFGAIRVAITARTVAPPLFHTMAAIGREKVVRRLQDAARLVEAAATRA
jgi:glutamyl-tRNA synthetase